MLDLSYAYPGTDSSPPYWVRIDETVNNYRYVGKTYQTRGLTSQPVWQIYLERQVAINEYERIYADGDNNFNKVWDLRPTYFGIIPTPPFANVYSLNFDGINDILDCGQAASARYSGGLPLSFSCWIKPNGALLFPIFSKWENPGQGFVIYMLSNGRIRLFIRTVAVTNDLIVDSNSAIANDGVTWSHVVMTYDGSRSAAGVKFYLNGVLIANTIISNTLTSDSNTAATSVQIGAQSASSVYGNGNIDEVSIYTTVLSQLEIADMYNAGVPKDLSSLPAYSTCLSWYRMGDGSAFPNIQDVKSGLTGVMINMIASQIQGVVP